MKILNPLRHYCTQSLIPVNSTRFKTRTKTQHRTNVMHINRVDTAHSTNICGINQFELWNEHVFHLNNVTPPQLGLGSINLFKSLIQWMHHRRQRPRWGPQIKPWWTGFSRIWISIKRPFKTYATCLYSLNPWAVCFLNVLHSIKHNKWTMRWISPAVQVKCNR